jgi:hypothetical protein
MKQELFAELRRVMSIRQDQNMLDACYNTLKFAEEHFAQGNISYDEFVNAQEQLYFLIENTSPVNIKVLLS